MSKKKKILLIVLAVVLVAGSICWRILPDRLTGGTFFKAFLSEKLAKRSETAAMNMTIRLNRDRGIGCLIAMSMTFPPKLMMTGCMVQSLLPCQEIQKMLLMKK